MQLDPKTKIVFANSILPIVKVSMKNNFFLIIVSMLLSTVAYAGADFPSEEAFAKYIGQAAVQVNLSNKIQQICPNANLEPNLHEYLKDDFSKIPKLLDSFNETLEKYKELSSNLATDLVKTQGGCDAEEFKGIEKNIQVENANLMIKWMQKKF